MAGTGIDKIILSEDLKYIDPITVQRFYAIARSQLEILENFMKFQNLRQGNRRINIGSGVIVNCNISFGQRQAFIHIPTIGGEEETKTIIVTESIQHLLIVYGNHEEYLDIAYAKDSPVFIPENVTCTEGSGIITDVVDTRLYGTFILCWEAMIYGQSSNASGGILNAIESYYERKYKSKEIFYNTLSVPQNTLTLTGPMDQSPSSNISAENPPASTEMWTKTLGDLIVTAFIFYSYGIASYEHKKWAVFAQFEGTKLTWQSSGTFFPSTGYARCKMINRDWIDTFIGFDLWTTENPTTGELNYFVGILSDVEANYTVWQVNNETNQLNLIYQKQAQHSGTGYWRLIGYGVENNAHIAYWAQIGYNSGYTEEEMLNGSVGAHSTNGIVTAAIWNPIDRFLSLVVSSEPSEKDPTLVGPFSAQISHSCWAYYTSHLSEWCGTIPYRPTGIPDSLLGTVNIWGAKCSGDTGPDTWPYGFDSWSTGITRAWWETHTVIIYGSFLIGEDVYYQGMLTTIISENRKITLQRYHGYCSAIIPIETLHDEGIDASFKCETDRKEYRFDGWVWKPGKELSYQYSKKIYYSGTPNCTAGDWIGYLGGDEDLSSFIDSVFPYDHTWSAVLLNGVGRKTVDDNTKIAHSGYVIYKSGAALSLYKGDIGPPVLIDADENPIRAFFMQHMETTKQEIEL